MKIYVDLVLLLNFFFDFLLLLTVSYVLKRKTKTYRLLLGAFFGSLSTLLLFFPMTTLTLFITKVLISVVMIIISFKFNNIKYFFKNFFYLYIVSIVLGGFLYLLNIEFSYKQKGLIFFNNGLSINFIILIILSPMILYLYIKQYRHIENNYNYYHDVTIYFNNEVIECVGYLDTGNRIKDPYFNYSIMFINKQLVKDTSNFNILVPYQTVGGKGLIHCIMPIKIIIDGKIFKSLIALSEENIKIDGVNCIIPNLAKEILC